MTITDKPISHYLAPALLAGGVALAASNWYLQPERAAAWVAAVVLLACMAVALVVSTGRPTGEAIRRAVVFAGWLLVISLGATLVGGLDAMSRRATHVVLGAFFVATGNAMPKTLTPLSALRCDPAKVQAFQRFVGWTWVLTGVAYSLAWLVLPLDVAKPVSVAFLGAGMLLVATRIAHLRWAR